MSRRRPAPLGGAFLTPGTWFLLALMAVGYAFGLARYLVGLDGVTNLSDRYPWGIWKAVNVAAGVALAGCGFTTAALVDIFGRHRYRGLLRPALLTAWLGYLMVAVALLFDLGRYWNIWQPLLHWQGNSVLFEVAMCVVAYLVVLTMELAPAILDALQAGRDGAGRAGRLLTGLREPARRAQRLVRLVLPIFIVAGFVLSCMHHSSLGTLMVIAGDKLDPIWRTPLLPVLFLLSALMVGLPVVIAEILLAARVWRRRPDMELLSRVAALVPWPIALYLAVRLGDLWARRGRIDLLAEPGRTVALAVEIVAGLLLPLVLLASRRVRRSPGLLLTACLLLAGGVLLNRIDVYLVGYRSPFATSGYWPSLGELALTVALLATIVVGFRLGATWLPILSLGPPEAGPVTEPAPASVAAPTAASGGRPFSPWAGIPARPAVAGVVRLLALGALAGFVVLYASVHREALRGRAPSFRGLPAPSLAGTVLWRQPGRGHEGRPRDYRSFYWLEDSGLNWPADYYEPVRFGHRSHDVATGGDCRRCHHRVSWDADDRVGSDLTALHLDFEVRLGGPCSGCHDDLAGTTFRRCTDCHAAPLAGGEEDRPGLKAAYHRQCLGCHRRTAIGADPEARAPTDCRGCHRPRTPDHGALVALAATAEAAEVTAACLACHERDARDLLRTAHWNWSGPTPGLALPGRGSGPPLLRTVDGYTVTVLPQLVPSEPFHVGLPGTGGPPSGETGRHEALTRIDCLVCHDATGLYRPDASRPGPARPSPDLALLAARVGPPTRAACGSCHFHVGGWPNARHGDLEPALRDPDPELDVHMGAAGMLCTDCHLTRRHRVAGLSFGAPATEGRVRCERCHGERPHGIAGPLGPHLDAHVASVACQTCHVPHLACGLPTLLARDLSRGPPTTAETAAGAQARVAKAGAGSPDDGTALTGRPAWDPRLGALTWGRRLVPTYRWFDGTREVTLLGQPLAAADTVDLNAPHGLRRDPAARIHPFKTLTAVLPREPEAGYLLPLDLQGDALVRGDLAAAIAAGCRAAGLEWSGRFDFLATRTWSGLHHEVPPAREALSCGDCHAAEAVGCGRCHAEREGTPPPASAAARQPTAGLRLRFAELGYEGDPAATGGRFAGSQRPGRR